MKNKFAILAFTILFFANTANAINPCNCKGYAGPGGSEYSGLGGNSYNGSGGARYSGPGGPCY